MKVPRLPGNRNLVHIFIPILESNVDCFFEQSIIEVTAAACGCRRGGLFGILQGLGQRGVLFASLAQLWLASLKATAGRRWHVDMA